MRKSEKLKIVLSLWAVFIVLCIGGCSALNNFMNVPDDNIAEEVLEDYIEYKTGLSVDLTPESPER